MTLVRWLLRVCGLVLFAMLAFGLAAAGAYVPLRFHLPSAVQVSLVVCLPFVGLWIALWIGAKATCSNRL